MNSKNALFDDLYIGATVWYYNSDKRRYVAGSHANQITEREKFEPVEITGETRVSWLTDRWGGKIPKNPAKRTREGWKVRTGWSGHFCLNQDAMDYHIWDCGNRYRIVSAVQSCTTEQLKAIAKIVGFNE